MQQYRPDREDLPEIDPDFFNAQRHKLNELMDRQETKRKLEGYSVLERTKIGRNEPCPCNSGKKFKKCCISKAITE
ncbi:MAG: hypothetical protein COA78_12000 [Blastopirellula sp.]|nr:MAG: hypothetical protein COA78_12000 [Blastopirellula sp.]